jgi:hypothetical protein
MLSSAQRRAEAETALSRHLAMQVSAGHECEEVYKRLVAWTRSSVVAGRGLNVKRIMDKIPPITVEQ